MAVGGDDLTSGELAFDGGDESGGVVEVGVAEKRRRRGREENFALVKEHREKRERDEERRWREERTHQQPWPPAM